MAHLIVVTSAQVKTYLVRFEALLAQDPAGQARLREIEERREAEQKRLGATRPAPPAAEKERIQ